MLSAVSFWLALLDGFYCDGSVVRLAEFRAWLGVISVMVFFVAFVALAICEALSRGNRKHTIAFVAFSIAMTIAAQKNMTNGTDGVSSPLLPMMQTAGLLAAPDDVSGSATNEAGSASLEITSFFITTNGAGFAMCWPSGLDFAYLELQHSERLVPSSYTLLDRWTVDAAQTNDTRFVAFGGSFTNAASGFFTAFGHTCGGDPDGDGLPTGMERTLGTDPFAADTDGDGSSDGDELGVATVLTGSGFLWFDISNAVNRIRWDQDSYWWIDNPDERLRFGGERLGHVESSVDGFTHLYVSEIPNVWSCGWCGDGVSFRTDSLSGGYLTVAAANADLYARPDAWGSAFRYASVVTNGMTCYVLQCSNLGLKENRTGDSPLLSYEVILPEDEPDVAYVSYGRVDAGIRSLDMELGVQVAAWRNPHATNEYYTLMCPVACSNLCAGTTIRYKLGAATDPLVFDTDGDGAPDGADPFPHDRALGSYGQDETWVRMNFTNAEEILSVGYANWVDAQVGVGLTNGLYKFTATFPSAPVVPTRLIVGGIPVLVNASGDYVFLLEKGRDYEFSASPFNDAAEYSIQDDLASGSRLLASVGDWGAQGEWTVGGGDRWITYPGLDIPGTCNWLPTLRGSPGVAHLGPEDFPATFDAVLSDYRGSAVPSFQWTTSNPDIHFVSPNAKSTSVTCYSFPSWATFAMSVQANFGGYSLLSTSSTTYGTNETPQVHLSLDVPEGLALNGERRLLTVNFESDISTNGCVVIRCINGADKISLWSALTNGVSVASSNSWNVVSTNSFSCYAQGTALSDYQGVEFECAYVPESGSNRVTRAKSTVFECYTQPVSNTIRSGLEVVNPSFLNPKSNAVFKVEVNPNGIPSPRINWRLAAGSAVFQSGTNGTETVVLGSSGMVDLQVSVLGATDERMHFKSQVVQ